MIVLDTDVLIQVLRRHGSTMDWLEATAASDELATTSLNVAELLRGVPRRGRAQQVTHAIWAGLTEVPFGPRAARRFGRMMHDLDRAGTPVPVVDAMVAAATLEAGGILATWNTKHLKPLVALETVQPDR
ncbi:MAG: type II toxin-antitoxin system VapC family toxin [Thermoplasmatota archaeon]